MKRILVIFTGGTIGCMADENGVLTVKSHENSRRPEDYLLINEFCRRENMSSELSFEVMEPVCVLSENMTINVWNILIDTLKNVDFTKYAGIIVTHGTDTMAYTANLLGHLWKNTGIPLVLVGSDRNLHDEKCNGHDNFRYGVRFIMENPHNGVYVSWRDNSGANLIYHGNYIGQAMNFTNEFTAVRGNIFGHYEQDRFIYTFNEKMKIDENELPYIGDVQELKECVCLIQPYVGLRYDMIHLSEGIRAVLHGTYHSSTFCMDGEHTSIQKFAKDCSDRNIDLYVAPYESDLYGSGMRYVYETTKNGMDMGIKVIPDVSIENAYTKLLIKYSSRIKGDED